MKLSLEFEKIPAVGVLFGYQKETGVIIMLPFISLTIKKVKKKKFHVNSLKVSKNQLKEVINKI